MRGGLSSEPTVPEPNSSCVPNTNRPFFPRRRLRPLGSILKKTKAAACLPRRGVEVWSGMSYQCFHPLSGTRWALARVYARTRRCIQRQVAATQALEITCHQVFSSPSLFRSVATREHWARCKRRSVTVNRDRTPGSSAVPNLNIDNHHWTRAVGRPLSGSMPRPIAGTH